MGQLMYQNQFFSLDNRPNTEKKTKWILILQIIYYLYVFIIFYRCHSYCWANWSAREPSKKLLQEVLTTCKKTWGQISGKEIFYCTVNQLFSNYFIKMNLLGNQSHIQEAQME